MYRCYLHTRYKWQNRALTTTHTHTALPEYILLAPNLCFVSWNGSFICLFDTGSHFALHVRRNCISFICCNSSCLSYYASRFSHSSIFFLLLCICSLALLLHYSFPTHNFSFQGKEDKKMSKLRVYCPAKLYVPQLKHPLDHHPDTQWSLRLLPPRMGQI